MRRFAVYQFFGLLTMLAITGMMRAQCTNYTITITAGSWPGEVFWQLNSPGGTLIASGGAPATVNVCLNNGAHTLLMYDSYGDGWNGAVMTIRCATGTIVFSNLTLNSGSFASTTLNFNGSLCGSVSCPPGTSPYTLQVSTGSWPSEVSWALSINGSPVSSGGASSNTSLCLAPGCYTFTMYDSYGDGWNGAQYTLISGTGTVLQSGTLSFGFVGTAQWPVGGATCSGGGGSVTASDCVDAVNVCTDLSFSINPNGYGQVDEIPAPGSISNPIYTYADGITSPWGTDNYGCLLNGETNSTWMIVNIWQGGTLTFTFGGLGSQAGYYDWIMYPYGPNTCQQVFNGTIAPVRCNWNLVAGGGTGLASTLPAGGSWGNYEPPLAVLTGSQYLIVFSNWSSVTTTVPLQFGGSAVVSCQSLSVATELIDFACEPLSKGALLWWTTATESQTAQYIVERSVDGLTKWVEVGRVDAAGESFELRRYSLIDSDAGPGRWYYRLKELDTNGEIIPIGDCVTELPSVQGSWVMPNPAGGMFRIPSHLADEILSIIDLTGREVLFTMHSSCEGCLPEISMTSVKAGVYLIRLARTGEAQRFVWSP